MLVRRGRETRNRRRDKSYDMSRWVMTCREGRRVRGCSSATARNRLSSWRLRGGSPSSEREQPDAAPAPEPCGTVTPSALRASRHAITVPSMSASCVARRSSAAVAWYLQGTRVMSLTGGRVVPARAGGARTARPMNAATLRRPGGIKDKRRTCRGSRGGYSTSGRARACAGRARPRSRRPTERAVGVRRPKLVPPPPPPPYRAGRRRSAAAAAVAERPP